MEQELQQAWACFQQGQLNSAQALCRKILSRQPQHAAGMHCLGMVHCARGDDASGLKCLLQALEYHPSYAACWFDLGNIHMRQGDYPAAAKAFVEACELEPEHLFSLHALADCYARQGDYDNAIEGFNRVLATHPQWAVAHFNLGNAYKCQYRYVEAAVCYERAIALQPSLEQACYNLANVRKEQHRLVEAAELYRKVLACNAGHVAALANLAVVYDEQGMVDEAVTCLERAIALEPENEHLQYNLDQVRSRQILPWHFTMLADTERNNAFERAINRVVKPGSHVLDIGAGSGLLSMMAARARATRVTACEMVPAIAAVAEEVIRSNGYAEQVQVINKKSTQLQLGEDLDEKVDVIVAEVLDMGVLGEGIIPSLRHARAHLAHEQTILIPRSARIRAQLVALPQWRAAHPLGRLNGFDLSAFDRFRGGRMYKRIELQKEQSQAFSEVFDVCDIDFYHLPEPVADSQPAQYPLTTPVTADGCVHAVVFWFELTVDEQEFLSTGPEGGARSWGQAVQFFDENIPVSIGGQFSLQFSQSDQRICFSHPCFCA